MASTPTSATGPAINEIWRGGEEITTKILPLIEKAQAGENIHFHDWEIKYLNVRIDMRDGKFYLTDKEGNYVTDARIQKLLSL